MIIIVRIQILLNQFLSTFFGKQQKFFYNPVFQDLKKWNLSWIFFLKISQKKISVVPSTREILNFFINQLLKAVSFSMNLQELLFVSFKSIKKS